MMKSIRIAVLIFLFYGRPAFPQQGASQGAQAVLKDSSRLSLTVPQQKEIRGIISKTAGKFNEASRARQGAAKLAAIRLQGQKEALQILTPEQAKLWSYGATGENKTRNADDQISNRSLIIPTIAELKNPPSRGAFGPSAELVKTEPHPPIGQSYVIITDHTNPIALRSLEKLAEFRGGDIIHVKGLGGLHLDKTASETLRKQLVEKSPRFVAIAPIVESYRENLHLLVLKLLTRLDSDPELDAFPGYLIASDPEHLKALVERTIQYRALALDEIKPVSIGAIEDANSLRYRSYQKAKVIQKMFGDAGKESPSIILTTKKSHTARKDFPDLSGPQNIAMLPDSERHTFQKLPEKAKEVLSQNNLLFMFGHGTTNRICGTQISAFSNIDFSNEVVFCGSCMSATPYQADRLDLTQKQNEKRFAFHAMDNGAIMLFGHMGLCGGFPKVFPMAELTLEGLPAGEAYQRLVNGLIKGRTIPEYYPTVPGQKARQPDPANGLLYVLFGDPALVPIGKK